MDDGLETSSKDAECERDHGVGGDSPSFAHNPQARTMAFQTQVTTRHVDVSDRVLEYARERTAKLEQFYDGIVSAHVVLGEDNSPAENKTASINIDVYQQRLSADDAATNHEEAINLCVDHLRRQLEKYKAKLRSTDKDSHR
jgi:putative sigma-54 modulation protein